MSANGLSIDDILAGSAPQQNAQGGVQPGAPAKPQGLSIDDIIQASAPGNMANQAATAPQSAPQAPAPAPGFLAGMGRAAVMTGRDVLQGALALPEMLHDAIIRAPYNAIASAIGSPSRIAPGAQQIDYWLNRAGVPNPQPVNGVERVVGNVDKGLGSVLGGFGIGSALGTSASPVAQTVGNVLTNNLGTQAIGAAAGPAAASIAKGVGLGGTGQAVAGTLGAMSPFLGVGALQGIRQGTSALLGSPTPEAAALADQAQQLGIPLKASQVSPSKVAKLVDSATSQVPLSGAGKFAEQQQTAFNQAVGRTIGADAPKITPPVFNAAKQRIGGEFDRLVGNANVPLSTQFLNDLQTHIQDAAHFEGADVASRIQGIAQRLVDQSQNDVIPGRVMKDVDTRLGQVIASGGPASYPLGKLQETLRDAMEQSAPPQDAQAWATARQQYRDLKTIEPLVAKSTTGDISPAALMGRVTANNAGKAAMARGSRGDLGSLARIGQQFLKEPIADSGTARRLAAFEGLKGIGAALAGAGLDHAMGSPTALLGLGATMGLSRGTQNVLQSPALIDAMLGRANPWGSLGQAAIPSAYPMLTTQHLLNSSGSR